MLLPWSRKGRHQVEHTMMPDVKRKSDCELALTQIVLLLHDEFHHGNLNACRGHPILQTPNGSSTSEPVNRDDIDLLQPLRLSKRLLINHLNCNVQTSSQSSTTTTMTKIMHMINPLRFLRRGSFHSTGNKSSQQH